MKTSFIFFLVLFSSVASAHKSDIPLLKTVLSDSIIAKYVSTYSEIDPAAFVLLDKSGTYLYNHGDVSFDAYNGEVLSSPVGFIRKMKNKETKATVKIYFKENKSYYTKVKLRRLNEKQPWLIYSRLIYRPFHISKNHSRIFHYSFNW